jgi:uncharacterized delta-60 repeat protein
MLRRRVLPGLLGLSLLLPAGAMAAQQSGSLDKAFSGDGKALVDFGKGQASETAHDVLVRSNGKVVLVGELAGETVSRWAVARLRADGRPDRTFSGNGRAATPLGADAAAYAVLGRSEGRLLVGGASDGQFAVVAYAANGALDGSWDGDGIVTTPIPAGPAQVHQLRRLDDGTVLAAGSAGGHAVVVRYLADGTLDDTFGDSGVVTAPAFAGEVLRVRVQADGGILATGEGEFDLEHGGVTGIRTERYEADGDPLASFGGGGVTTYHAEAGEGHAVLRQPDGKVLVAGSFFGEGDYRYHVVIRYLADGTPDPSFGPSNDSVDGVVRGLFDCCYAQFRDMELQSDGRIVVAGWTAGETPRKFLVGRYTSAGAPDGTFTANTGGQKSFRGIGLTNASEARALAIRGGRIVVAGWAGYSDSAAFAVARLHK